MPSVVRICFGVSLIVITFLVGMILMVDSIVSGYFDVGLILFYSLGLPMIGILIAIPVMCTGVRRGIGAAPVGTVPLRYSPPATQGQPVAEASYVYEPPTICPDCGGKLTSSNIDWVGPLTVKCPYCGSSVPAVKRRV
jgi:hypothetical protein